MTDDQPEQQRVHLGDCPECGVSIEADISNQKINNETLLNMELIEKEKQGRSEGSTTKCLECGCKRFVTKSELMVASSVEDTQNNNS